MPPANLRQHPAGADRARPRPMVRGRALRCAEAVPAVRSYGRALTGAQDLADRILAETLGQLLTDRSALDAAGSARLGLYAAYVAAWLRHGAPVACPEGETEAQAQADLAPLEPLARAALLLQALAGMEPRQIAAVLNLGGAQVRSILAQARTGFGQGTGANSVR